MINIEAVLEEDGTLRACRASGHAGYRKVFRVLKKIFRQKQSSDIVCAAVSVLMRTAYLTLSNRQGIILRSGAPEKGQMWLEADYEAEGKDFLLACGIFLINGLMSVAQEYPKNCKINIRRI